MSKRESIELTDKSSDFRYLMVMVLIALFLQAFALIFNALLFAVISVIVVSIFEAGSGYHEEGLNPLSFFKYFISMN